MRPIGRHLSLSRHHGYPAIRVFGEIASSLLNPKGEAGLTRPGPVGTCAFSSLDSMYWYIYN
jgi:hypothetical protein